MNTNQIPPGIVAFKMKGGLIGTCASSYNTWVSDNLNYGNAIHTISVDGTEWSVGEWVVNSAFPHMKELNIKSFEWIPESKATGKGHWKVNLSNFMWKGSEVIERLTKPLPHSGGEEGESEMGFFKSPTNQGEAGGKSKEVDIETLYHFAQWQGISKERVDFWLNNIETPSLKQQLKEKQSPIEWPGDEQIEKFKKDFFKEIEYEDSPPQYSEMAIDRAINWLKQQVGNKEFEFQFSGKPVDTSNNPNLTGNNQINQIGVNV